MPILPQQTLFCAALFVISALASPIPQSRLIVDLNDEEIVRRDPELADIRFDRDVALVETVLVPALEAVKPTFATLDGLTAEETISELRLDNGGSTARAQTEHFNYVVAPARKGMGFREQRLLEGREKEAASGEGGFVASRQLFAWMEMLLPRFGSQLRIRPVGRLGDTVVFAFMQAPGVAVAGAQPEPIQGLVWVDAKRSQPVRLRCLQVPITQDATLDERSVDLTFARVHFEGLDGALLVPVRVVVDVRRGDVRTHAVHRLTEFHLSGNKRAGNASPATGNAQVYTVSAERDALEQLGEGAVALDADDAAGAIAPLHEALRRDPALAAAHYHLARALRATGDAADAEIEVRSALAGMGRSPAAHNLLGVLLLDRGAAADALAELRETVQLAPGQATAHRNLSSALEATGDRPGALAELRRAIELDPANKELKIQLDRMASAPSPAANENRTTIRVDVRQVLVPVVVLDNAGRNVSGLKQSDFRVFEDGVEQTMTSFGVETSVEAGVETVSGTPDINTGEPKPVAKRPALGARPRHTYLIVVDSLHSAFENMRAVRKALRKLFASEPPGDSQYGVIALGQSMTIIQNLTRDPAAAFASLDDKAFYKMVSGNWSTAKELRDFLRHLEDVRRAVDTGDPTAAAQMNQLPADAEQLANMDRHSAKVFLGGLRSLVSQLGKGADHSTLILISDGFQIAPGHDAWELLRAYFPELPHTSLQGHDRMQSEFDSVVKIAARSNIVIHTIDSRGLYVSSWLDASMSGQKSSVVPRVMMAMNAIQLEAGLSLAEFAAATGGTSYNNSNDILSGIRRAVAQDRDFYTLGYVPLNTAMDGRFRKITIEMKRRGLTLRTKRGYWATEK